MNRSKSFDGKRPTLYLIATPIGNLKEMSPRALEVISEADIIAAEDTRNAFSLLANFNIKKELLSSKWNLVSLNFSIFFYLNYKMLIIFYLFFQ